MNNRELVAAYLADLRDRGDKPHIWMSNGMWKVNDMPRYRGITERIPLMALWNAAQKAVMRANLKIALTSNATHIRWANVSDR